MDNGGWNLTCIWLQEAVDTDIDMLIFDILTIIRNTTVTIDRLISNAIPCLIKQLLNTHINPGSYYIYNLLIFLPSYNCL